MKFQEYNIGDVVFRHGDVLLKKTNRCIEVATKKTREALYSGQNHNHDIVGEYYLSEVMADGKRYLGVKDVMLLHPEHGAISINAAEINNTELEIDIQQEYDHFLEESRRVID